MDINKLINQAIFKYFDALTQVGYLKEDDMLVLLISQHIQDLVSYKFILFIDEESYKIISDAIYTLSCKSCLLSVPYLPTYDDLFRMNNTKDKIRMTQDNSVRHTEDSITRVKA